MISFAQETCGMFCMRKVYVVSFVRETCTWKALYEENICGKFCMRDMYVEGEFF